MALPPPSPGSVALVTGASSGIGEQLARRLAGRGHAVALVARRVERLQALAAELRDAHGVAAHALACDLADPAARDALADQIDGLGLTVEVLVNSAGFGIYRFFAGSPREDELRQIDVDVAAVVDLTSRFLPGMVERGRGAVINLSSTAGLQPLPGNATYAAAKAYVLFFSEALHSEVRDRGVTVTAVCPGPVPTEFQERNDAVFAEKMPRFTWSDAGTVAEQALQAADRGRRTIVPGSALTKLSFAGNRYAPPALALAIGKRLMSR